jgi:uncharacterized protein (TIGR03437 family)
MTTGTPGVDEIVGITGSFSTTSGGFSGSIVGLSPASYNSNNPTVGEIDRYDNLYYPSGSAPGVNGNPPGGTLDDYGLDFMVAGGYTVNVFEKGTAIGFLLDDGLISNVDHRVPISFVVAVIPPPSITKIVDAAAGNMNFAPGMPIEITGTNLGASPTDEPTIMIGGEAAPILSFISSTDVIAEIPVDAATGTAAVVATYEGASSTAYNITIGTVAPEIYLNVTSGGSSFYNSGSTPITSGNPASANSEVYLLAAGLGPTNPAQLTNTMATVSSPTTMPVQVMVGNLMIMPSYAGLFVGGAPGTYQVAFTLPADVAVGSDPVVISVGGVSSNTATLVVGPPVPSITAVVNGATFKANPAAPNSFVSIFGTNFGSHDTPASIFPATTFNDVTVLFNGVAAPLYYVFGSSGQMNLVLPSNLPETGTVNVQVVTSQGASSSFALQMGAADVGMFRIPDPSDSSRMNGAVLFANSVWRVMPASMAMAIGFPSCAGAAATTVCGQPAATGDAILIFLTGLGLATPNGDPSGQPVATGSVAPASGTPLYRTVQTPTVTIGGIPATVAFSGITPGNAGLYQINVTIPDGVPAGDNVPVLVTMPSGSADTVTIAVH